MSMSDMRELGTLQVTSTAAPPGGVLVELAGELDLSTVPIFVEAIDEILGGPPTAVELDLSKLTFIDSSGVGAYVTAYRRAQAKGSRLSVGGRSPLVDRVLQLSGVEEALAAESAGGN
jgi:anti-sigma B factor antagonist